MAKSDAKQPGFFRGVVYGLVLSGAAFVALSVVFPLATGAPDAVIGDIAQVNSTGFDVSLAPDTGSGVVLGDQSDSIAMPALQAPIDSDQTVQAPTVESQSADRPVIGNGPQTTQLESDTQAPEVTGNTPADNPVETVSSTAPPALQDLASGSAIEVFSASFEIEPGKQIMAIILEDTLEEDLTSLLATGVPFSFAIPADTQDPNAGKGFRDLGYEVLVMIPEEIPTGQNMSDLIINYIGNVPASVALIDNSYGGILRDESSSQAFFNVVSQTGHGAVSFAGAGDDRARDLAVAAGVPYGTITRIVDVDPDPFTIMRALGRASLAAQTTGSAIVYARTRPSTIAALIEWLASDRASRIQIVPASVVLNRQ